VDLKMDVAALREENLSLRAELRAAPESQDQRSHLEHRENVYFLREPGNRHAGPYCPRCYDVEQRLVTVATLPPEFQDMATYRCSHCKGTY
jgi:hypothetical protein